MPRAYEADAVVTDDGPMLSADWRRIHGSGPAHDPLYSARGGPQPLRRPASASGHA